MDDIKPRTEPTGWLQSAWEKVATVIAVIGLIDVSGQLIKWAAVVHWIAEHYADMRTWLFGWLPFHISSGWQNSIVLCSSYLTAMNVGLYRKTKRTIISHLLNRDIGITLLGYCVICMLVIPIAKLFLRVDYNTIYIYALAGLVGIVMSKIVELTALWMLTMVSIFSALVFVNYAYVQWLEPLAEHH